MISIRYGKQRSPISGAAVRYRSGTPVIRWLGGAALLGAIAGVGSAAYTVEGRQALAAVAKPVAVALGGMRERAPQEGDFWPGCNAARAAGTAPIYRGEPGYREGMDGDGDGVACEPHREGTGGETLRLRRIVGF